MRRHVLLLTALAASCSQPAPVRPAGEAVPEQPQLAASTRVDRGLLRNLALIASARLPTTEELSAIDDKLASGEMTLDDYIDGLVKTDGFADSVMPQLIGRQWLRWFLTDYYVLQLHTFEAPDKSKIYYLRDRCKPKRAVDVRPWWDMSTTVKVCPDAYLPKRFHSTKKMAGEPRACYASPTDDLAGCGCGPNLMRCPKDQEHRQELIDAITEEAVRSIGYVANSDLPLKKVFTSVESFRTPKSEYLYLLARMEREQVESVEPYLAELAKIPEDGAWLPRHITETGQHSGILTSNQILGMFNDRRQRMTAMYDLTWCMGADSVGATAEAVLSLGGGNAQFDAATWKQLAHRPICTNCHARMDYGFQFFLGYNDGRIDRSFRPELQQGSNIAPLYGRNIDDRRGEAPQTPRGFGELVTSQPEYYQCMARSFTGYAFGRDTPPEAMESLAKMYREQPKLTPRDLMRWTLKEYAQRYTQRSAAEHYRAMVASKASVSDRVELDGELAEVIEDQCIACHDEAPGLPNFASTTVPRQTAFQMIAAISNNSMPKGGLLQPDEKALILSALVNRLFATDEERRQAFAFFETQLAGLPVHSIQTTLGHIKAVAGATRFPPLDSQLEVMQHADNVSLTAGFAAVTSAYALEACKKSAGSDLAAFQKCVDESLDLDVMVK